MIDSFSNNKQVQQHNITSVQIRQQISEQVHKINKLLSKHNEIKTLRKLIKKCNYNSKHEDDIRSKALIWKYNPEYDYIFQPYDQQPQLLTNQKQLPKIEVEVRNNWICWLDRMDTQVYGHINSYKVKIQSQNNQIIKYHHVNQMNTNNNINNNNKSSRKIKINELQQHQISLSQFYTFNKSIQVVFVNHRYLYQFGNSLIRLNLFHLQKDSKETIIINARNKNTMVQQQQQQQEESIRRFIVFRLEIVYEQQQQQNLIDSKANKNRKQQQYRVYDGYYQPYNFIQTLNLPQGQYIIMPLNKTNINIYTTNHLDFEIIKQQDRCQIKQLNLLLQGFVECHQQNIKAEYMRQCDLNKGIIIQVYRNVYDNIIQFQDVNEKNKKKKQQQNIKLMFQTLYSQRYQSYRLKSGQTIVQFYEVTSKPAVLYQPQKKIIIDKDEDMEAQTIHSILK